MRDLPNYTPVQKNTSPVNFWPLSISPYEEKKMAFSNPSNTSTANSKKTEGPEKNEPCAEFKKKKPL